MDRTGRRFVDLECRFLANNGLPGHVAGTSALPPGADSQDGGAVRYPLPSGGQPTVSHPAYGFASRLRLGIPQVDQVLAERSGVAPATHQV